MTFDQYGHLTPYELIETDLSTFEAVFVGEFSTSTTRPQIFEAYLDYLEQLKEIVGTGFYQWIDGSFITNTLNPDDIDFLSWVDLHTYENKKKELTQLRQLRFEVNSKTDGYILPFYAQHHKKMYLNEINEKQWLFDWAYDDDNHPKGLIKLIF